MVELIGADKAQPAAESTEEKTFIHVENNVMVIQINLGMADSIQAYGTCQKAMELCSRYYMSQEIAMMQQKQRDRSIIQKVADSISKR